MEQAVPLADLPVTELQQASDSSGTALVSPVNSGATTTVINPAVLQILNNQRDSRWLTLEVCREYQRGNCKRSSEECKYAHPPAGIEVQNGRVTCCFDSIKGKCQRNEPPCKYLHPPNHLKEKLVENGRANLIQRAQVQAMVHNALMQGVLQAPAPMMFDPATGAPMGAMIPIGSQAPYGQSPMMGGLAMQLPPPGTGYPMPPAAAAGLQFPTGATMINPYELPQFLPTGIQPQMLSPTSPQEMAISVAHFANLHNQQPKFSYPMPSPTEATSVTAGALPGEASSGGALYLQLAQQATPAFHGGLSFGASPIQLPSAAAFRATTSASSLPQLVGSPLQIHAGLKRKSDAEQTTTQAGSAANGMVAMKRQAMAGGSSYISNEPPSPLYTGPMMSQQPAGLPSATKTQTYFAGGAAANPQCIPLAAGAAIQYQRY